MKYKKILILSGNYGHGHQQAANAIFESLRSIQPGVEGVLVDFMELTHPYVHPVSRYLFLKGMKKLPSAYGYLYSKTRNENAFSTMLKKFNRYGLGGLLKLLHTIQPSVVISTFPLAAGAMSVQKEYGQSDAHTATIITDHTDHNSWVYPYTDQYLVGSDYVKRGLEKYSIPSHKISVTGIPIRSAFSKTYDRDVLFHKHALDPSLPTLLLMGGGCGLFEEGQSLMRALETLPFQLQYFVVCGRNLELQQQLTKELKHSKHRVHIKGFVDYVHELMSVADLMVTKPGGLTISEGLAMELPMILYKPLPGQEEDNAQFLLQSGAAMTADHTQELIEKIAESLQTSERLHSLMEKSRYLQRKTASDDVVHAVLQACNEYTVREIEQCVPSWPS
jgi:processive 1,2-diacylglycerol beta-glucosyltransferase